MKNLLYLFLAVTMFGCSGGGDGSNDSDNSGNADDNDNNSPTGVQLGDFIQGGIVFWINPNDPNDGMVISIEDGSLCNWGGCESTGCGTHFGVGTVNDFGKGDVNTQRIVNAYNVEPLIGAGHNINQYEHEGYNDWFLPSNDEFQRICSVRLTINNYIIENGGDALDGEYWSSSEYNDRDAVFWRFNEDVEVSCIASAQYKFPLGNRNPVPKWRGIRKFQL